MLSSLALAKVWASSLQTAYTEPVCPDSVSLQVAVVKSQILIVLSQLPLARVWASSLQTAATSRLCPDSVCVQVAVFKSQILIVLSSLALARCGHPACRLLLQCWCVLIVFVYKLLLSNPRS